jgi:proteasome lid subunit RPN8/RPN11
MVEDAYRSPAEMTSPMEEQRVRLGPAQQQEPHLSCIPLHRARKWSSPFEQREGRPAVAVFVSQPAFLRICACAAEDMENEVGGVLVGRWRMDRNGKGQFIIVEGAILARHTRQGSAYLTFTQDSLVALHAEQEERYPRKRMVGWFHTHPRMGVFLSEYDLWLHQHFFSEPWQVALVIEPHSSVGGFFVRDRDGGMDPHGYQGFHELLGRRGESVVHWSNLEPEQDGKPAEGG